MANRVQILDKIERNCHALGIVTSRTDAVTLVAGSATLTYVDAVIAGPMGGVDGSVSPFLGIGIANPGKIAIDIAGALSTITAAHMRVIRVASGHANNILINNGGSLLVELEGSSDMLGMGM